MHPNQAQSIRLGPSKIIQPQSEGLGETKLPDRCLSDRLRWQPNLRLAVRRCGHEEDVGKQSMTTELPSHDEIRQALQREGEDALARFFGNIAPKLKRIVKFRLDYRLSGRVSESDVIQETYVRAAQRMPRYIEKEPTMPFFVWLRLEVSQKLDEIHRQHFGAQKRDIRKEMKLGGNEQAGKTSMAMAAHLVAQMTSPSRVFERAEQIAKLEKALSEMDELDQEVIALRHFEELSNVEAAEVLGLQPSAASKRYLRALVKLRKIMESASHPPGEKHG